MNPERLPISEDAAHRSLAIFGLVNELTGSENVAVRNFGQDMEKKGKYFFMLRRLKIFLDTFHKNKLDPKECFKVLGVEDKISHYKFSEDGKVVQISRSTDYHTFSSSFSYDDNGNIIEINISYYNGKESFNVIPKYNENLECVELELQSRSEFREIIIKVPCESQERITQSVFPPKDSEIEHDIYSHLENTLLRPTSEANIRRSGIIYNSWEEIREALILFAEGNISKRGTLNNIELEGQSWLDHGLIDISKIAVPGRDKTAQASEWVDSVFSPNTEIERSFDYPDFDLPSGGYYPPNNFHKCFVEINHLPGGRYILKINSNHPQDNSELQLAQATLQERVINFASQEFEFPSTEDYFYIGGLQNLKQALIKNGYEINWNSALTLASDVISLDDFYNKETESTRYNYVYSEKQFLTTSFVSENFKITLELNLPRASRVGFQILKDEDDKPYLDPYDSWNINISNGVITGRVNLDSIGRRHLPTIKVSVEPIALKSPEEEDISEKILEVLENVRKIIESTNLKVA